MLHLAGVEDLLGASLSASIAAEVVFKIEPKIAFDCLKLSDCGD